MQFREVMSSSATLGFRVEGIKVWAAEEGAAEGSGASQVTEIGKEALSTENDEETVLARLRTFVHNDYKLARLYLERLTAIRSALSASALFMQHQARAAAAAQFYSGRKLCGVLARHSADLPPLCLAVDQHVAPLRARRGAAALRDLDDRLLQSARVDEAAHALRTVGARQRGGWLPQGPRPPHPAVDAAHRRPRRQGRSLAGARSL